MAAQGAAVHGMASAARLRSLPQRHAPKPLGYSEIAVSPFNAEHLVHVSDGDRMVQPHDVVVLASPSDNPVGWLRQTASVRLSSGCAVIMEHEEPSQVDLMHMLQVNPRSIRHIFTKHACFRPTLTPLPLFSGGLVATRAPISFSRSSYPLLNAAPPACSGTR